MDLLGLHQEHSTPDQDRAAWQDPRPAEKKTISKNPQPGSEGAGGMGVCVCLIPGSPCPALSKLLPPLAKPKWKPGQDPVPEMEGECT